jgi:hypothetical protein
MAKLRATQKHAVGRTVKFPSATLTKDAVVFHDTVLHKL